MKALMGLVVSLSLAVAAIGQVPTLINYQGRLLDGTNLVNGTVNMELLLYNSPTGGGFQYLDTGTVVVVDGLYSTYLGDGTALGTLTNALIQTNVYLEVTVNGVTLTPRERVASVAYAVRAGRAEAYSGAVLDSQLSTNIPRLDISATFSSTVTAASFSGPGAMPWQVVSGTNQQAQPNTGYLLTNDELVTVALPTAPNLADVVRVSGIGAGGWKLAQNASQAVETRNIAGNFGAIWTAHDSNRFWTSVASSSDGSKLIAVASGGHIYTSVNSGTNWTAQESNRFWLAVASSSDGSKLVAVVSTGQIYTSTDSGTNWTARDSNRSWSSAASSSDGSKLVAADGAGQIYTSVNSGTNWTAHESNRSWQAVASSSDGSKLVAADGAGQIYTSTDSGLNWTAREFTRDWMSATSSSDGSRLVAVDSGGQIYTSTDSGVTWIARDSSRVWVSVASSSDGSKLVAVDYGGQIYTSVGTTTSGTAGYLLGNSASAIELQYVGDGQFIPLSHEGTIVAY